MLPFAAFRRPAPVQTGPILRLRRNKPAIRDIRRFRWLLRGRPARRETVARRARPRARPFRCI